MIVKDYKPFMANKRRRKTFRLASLAGGRQLGSLRHTFMGRSSRMSEFANKVCDKQTDAVVPVVWTVTGEEPS